jgi:hypothetical protein
MSSEDIAWLVGFVEGEGTFCSRWRPNRDKFYPYFAVVNNDLSAIKEARRILGVGNITSTQPANPNAHAKYSLYVENRSDLQKVADFFRGRLKTEYKKKQFLEFERVLNSTYLTHEQMSVIRRRVILESWQGGSREKRLAIMHSEVYKTKMSASHKRRWTLTQLGKSEILINKRSTPLVPLDSEENEDIQEARAA